MLMPLAIIGAGPAGIAAAIQLKRSRCDFLLLEKSSIGGLLHEANCVENFPGIANGIAGRTLAARFQRQLAAAGIAVEKAQVQHLACRGGAFVLQTEKQTFTAARVILACGTMPLPIEPPLDQPWLRKRIFDSILPLLKCSRQTIVIIGGGDAAFDYALNLARKNRVHIVIRSNKARALPLLIERCRSHPQIVIHENSPLTSARKGAEADGVILEARGKKISCQRILTAIGRAPAMHFLASDLRASLDDFVKQKKIWIAGDASNGRFRQAAIAAADGLRAAMEIVGGQSK